MLGRVIALVVVALSPAIALAQDEHLIVGTWNVEHLGNPGRGFGGGFGAGSLPKRTPDQLDAIADFIRDELKADVLALQEVAITHVEQGRSQSEQLDRIVATLGDGWDYFLPPVSTPPPGNRIVQDMTRRSSKPGRPPNQTVCRREICAECTEITQRSSPIWLSPI